MDDLRDFVVGKAIIPWAPQTKAGGATYPEGWVLPGGRRTRDEQRVQRIAEHMDALMRGGKA